MSAPVPVPDYRGDFHSQTEKVPFANVSVDALQAIMHDKRLAKTIRVLVWAILYSWRNGSWYAIDPATAAPRFQRDCANELGIKKRLLSKLVNKLVSWGYLIDHPKLLYPSISPKSGTSQKVAEGGDLFTKFVENWKVAHPDDFFEYETAIADVKVAQERAQRIRKVMLSDFRKSREAATKEKVVAIQGDESRPQATPCTVLTSIEEVSRYVQGPESGPPAYLPTDSQNQQPQNPSVEDLILALPAVKAVERKLNDTLRQPLLGKIAGKLNGTPPERLDERIQLRFAKITSFGVLELFAEDVRKIWEADQEARARAVPANERSAAIRHHQANLLDPDTPETEKAKSRAFLREQGVELLE